MSSNVFRGFSEWEASTDDLFGYFQFIDETRRFIGAIVERLGPQIAHARFNAGRDERGLRDYFFENAELTIRGRRDHAFVGFFHYRAPEEAAGSHWQLWDWEHADDPAITIPIAELVREVREATAAGRLSDYMADRAEAIRSHLGLH